MSLTADAPSGLRALAPIGRTNGNHRNNPLVKAYDMQ
jgi:hypothetical protein